MTAVIVFFQILSVLLQVALSVIFAQAVLSWLIAFNVISLHNDAVRGIYVSLEKLTDPFYRPIRRILPDFGALDLSPMVVMVILWILLDISPTIRDSILSSM